MRNAHTYEHYFLVNHFILHCYYEKQTAITISMNRTNGAVDGEQRMTSVEIAELTGKRHKHVMEAIRKMEPAWENVQGSKFRLSQRNYELPTRRSLRISWCSWEAVER